MIQVTLGTNTNRFKVNVDPNRTLKSVLEENDIDFTKGTMHLDGSTLKPGDINSTFAAMGVTDSCYLISVVKSDNAQ